MLQRSQAFLVGLVVLFGAETGLAADKSLSDRLPAGRVVNGDFAATGRGKEKYAGKASLTINSRTGDTFKAKFFAKATDKPVFEFEVGGTIKGNNVSIKSLGAPRPFTMSGRLKDDYLTLQFNGPDVKGVIKLKAE